MPIERTMFIRYNGKQLIRSWERWDLVISAKREKVGVEVGNNHKNSNVPGRVFDESPIRLHYLSPHILYTPKSLPNAYPQSLPPLLPLLCP